MPTSAYAHSDVSPSIQHITYKRVLCAHKLMMNGGIAQFGLVIAGRPVLTDFTYVLIFFGGLLLWTVSLTVWVCFFFIGISSLIA